MYDWLQNLHPAVLAAIRVIIFVVMILGMVPPLIWWERRLLSWMQDRIGPNRTGTFGANFPIKFLRGKKTFGILQPIADGVKLFIKEDFTPAAIDRLIYFIAPAIALFPAFALGGTLPMASPEGFYGLLTPIANVDIGVLYIMAISSLGVYGVVLAGYASNNKYSMMGGLRASAQLISYELAMGVALAGVVMASGSLRLSDIVKEQETALWGGIGFLQNWFILTPFGFVSAVIFLICMVAETNRAPFDLPEAENEIIAGYHTEYSSMKFAVFFMGEYAAMFVFSGIFAGVFLGGYNILPIRWDYFIQVSPGMASFAEFMKSATYWLGPLVMLGKMITGITFYIWLRATLPRLRYDQLMNLGWKFLLPAAVVNFIVVAIWIMASKLSGNAWLGFLAGGLAYVILYYIMRGMISLTKDGPAKFEKRTMELSEGNVDPRAHEVAEPVTAT